MIMSTLKSLRWTDFFMFALLDPRALYRQISRNDPKPFALSFLVIAMIAIIEIITFSLLGEETSFFYFKITYGWIFVFLYLSLKIVIIASLMDLSGQFLGFKGKVRELISLLNFSMFPQVFLLPLVYIFKVFHFAPIFFYFFCSFALFIWSAVIAIQGISEMHSTGSGKAFLVFVFPYVFVWAILFFMLMLLITGFVGFLTG